MHTTHLLLVSLPISALSRKNGIVPLGSTLTAGETSASPWLSPSGDFAFGFQEVQHKDLFLLSIWYHKIPDNTVVWFVYSTNPVPRGSTVKLDPQTGLVHCDPRGLQLWSANVDSAQIDHGFMNDTATSFSRGRFYLRFRDDGNLVLVTKSVSTNVDDDAEYYNSKTSDSRDPLYSGSRVTFDGRGAMYIMKKDNQTEQLSPFSIPPASENYHRATIDFDGVFTHYYHPRTLTGNPNWKALGICRRIYVSAFEQITGAVELVDLTTFATSKMENQFVSVQKENLYDFEVVSDIDWPLSDFEQIHPSNERVCVQKCLHDCFCAVAIYRENNCWKKGPPLSNGKADKTIHSKAFIKTARVMNQSQRTEAPLYVWNLSFWAPLS
nr:G-type lectin S-receptor-like serine/threonine-protein kinase RLK1 [Coffea arabica]